MPLLLREGEHPRYWVTQQNKSRSPFLRLPIEVRVMIYEYVVYMKKTISPIQTGPRSNKFKRVCSYCQKSSALCSCPVVPSHHENGVSAYIQLTRSCSTFYEDLEAYPVFYRVNTFEFQAPSCAIVFIAALTQNKRDAIRRVTFTFDGSLWNFIWGAYFSPPAVGHDSFHLSALLHQCRDLRNLNFVANFFWGFNYDIFLPGFLQSIVEHVRGSDLHAPSLWSLPALSFSVGFGLTGNISLTDNAKFNVASHIPPDDRDTLTRRALTRNITKLLKQARVAFQWRQGIIDKGLRKKLGIGKREKILQGAVGQLLKDSVPYHQLGDAIRAAPLDFPGEDRAAQDIMKGCWGHISSRTRSRKERAKNVTPTGSIPPRTSGKYDCDGIFINPINHITDIRLVETGFQCRVVLRRIDSQRRLVHDHSWEDIERLFSLDGLGALRVYYLNHTRRHSPWTPSVQLQHLESIPPPEHIISIARDFMKSLIKEQPRSWENCSKEWKTLQTRYDRSVAELKLRQTWDNV